MLSFLSITLIGLAGACVGILFAPNKGKETRKKLKVLLEDLDDKTRDLIEESKNKFSS